MAPLRAMAHGDLHERIDEATVAIAQEPANGALYLKRGSLYLEHEDFDLALADFDRVAELEPDTPDLDLLRARALFRRGSAEDALTAVDRHLQQKPDDPEGLLVRARALKTTGAFKESVAAYDAAMENLPRPSPDYCIERARAAEAMGQDGAAEALRGLDRAIERIGPLMVLQQEAIEIEVQVGDLDGALARVDQILTRGGRQEGWLLYKAQLLTVAGRSEDALAVCGQVDDAIAALPERIRRTPACERTAVSAKELRARLEQGARP